VLFFQDDSWVASFLQDGRREWRYEAAPSQTSRGAAGIPRGRRRPAPAAEPGLALSAETCDIAEQVAWADGQKVSGLTIGFWMFNLAFEDGHELNTSEVQPMTGAPACVSSGSGGRRLPSGNPR